MTSRTPPRRPHAAARLSRLLLALPAALAATALAAPAEEEARRLDDRLFFVQALERGWEPLLADARQTVGGLSGESPEAVRSVRAVFDRARETYAAMRLAEGPGPGEARAFELFDELAQSAVEAAARPRYDLACADIEVRRARRFEASEDDASALDAAQRAVERVPTFEPAFDVIGRLGLKQAERHLVREDYVKGLEVLERAEGGLPESVAARQRIAARRQEILKTTGTVEVAWLGADAVAKVPGPRTSFEEATLDFEPQPAGPAPPPQSVLAPIRVRTGTYRVLARGPSGGPSFPVGQVRIGPGENEIALLAAIPAGMAFVPAAGSAEAFLVDLHEVSNAELRRVVPGARSEPGDPQDAAAGVPFATAQEYARLVGKRLPTEAQWEQAAFGAPGAVRPRYPWGDQPGRPQVHFHPDPDGPGPVTGCAAGASLVCGALNMAGNVYEWLDSGWFVGGAYGLDEFDWPVEPAEGSGGSWTADFLRDPIPTAALYQRMQAAEQARYFNYREGEGTLSKVGLRCVVPLGTPRRR